MSETEKKAEEKKKTSSKVKTPAQAGGPAPKSATGERAATPPSSPPKQPPADAKAAAPKSSTAAKAAVQKPPAAAPKASGSFRIRQIKSGICAPLDQKQTLLGLGLLRIRHEVVRPDTPAVRGQVHKVRHLVEIVEGGAAR
jgi:large subunit ribosomal protein L30